MKSKISLLGIAFISGAMVMIFEIIGARILAPSIGTSFYVWTALIGFVLASLSLGYYLGGYWIDIHPKKIWIAFSLLGAALSLMIVFVFKDDVLSWIVNHVKGLKVSAVIASVVLFVPASVFFGTITPMIAKLLLKELDMAGKTMGNVFAFSSIGSLAGTFLAGFYLLPTFSLNYILSGLIVVSIVLASLIFLSENNWLYLLISLLILMIFYISLKNKEVKTTSIYEFESAYNSIKVFPTIDYHTNDSILIMQLGRQRAGAMSLTNRPLPFNYLYYFRLAEYFNPEFTSALMLGGAAYSFPKYYLNFYSKATLDVVEIDEKVTEIAEDYFHLNSKHPNLHIFHEDARTFLNNCTKKYDVIYSDTFKSAISLPYQLTTIEAIQKQYNLLNDDGVVIVNVIQAVEGKYSLFLQAELKSFKAVFPQVLLFADAGPDKRKQIQSIIIVALKGSKEFDFVSNDVGLDSLLKKRVSEQIPLTQQILSDDFAPVDYLSFQGL